MSRSEEDTLSIHLPLLSVPLAPSAKSCPLLETPSVDEKLLDYLPRNLSPQSLLETQRRPLLSGQRPSLETHSLETLHETPNRIDFLVPPDFGSELMRRCLSETLDVPLVSGIRPCLDSSPWRDFSERHIQETLHVSPELQS